MTSVYFIRELVENSAAHADVLDGLDWIIVPVANPDGFLYSHTVVRFGLF